MTDEEKQQLEKLQKRIDRQDKIIALKDDDREGFDDLEGEEKQDEFLAKSVEDRKKERDDYAKKAEEADPVIYETDFGHRDSQVGRKDDGDPGETVR